MGWSKFLSCGFTTETYDQSQNATDISPASILLGPPPLTKDALTKQVQYMSFEGPACEKSEDLDYLGHLNTPTLARDLELVRSLTGYEEMNYWGSTYGSEVGVMYAALFPDRVGRMILECMLLLKLAKVQRPILKTTWVSPAMPWIIDIAVWIKFLGFWVNSLLCASMLPM